MRAYKGVVENGVVVVKDKRLPEGTIVTVTVGETELLRARISNAIRRSTKVKVRVKPNAGHTGLALQSPQSPPKADDQS